MLKQHGKKRQINERYEHTNKKYHQSDNEQISSPINLQKCVICNRRFTQNRLINHEQACQQSKKFHLNSLHHYHYNSQLHRWKGLDYNIDKIHINKKSQYFPKTHWREKHQEFQNIIKGQYNSLTTNDLIQSLDDRPYQCSQCQRKFTTENAITKHKKGCTGNRILKKTKL